MRSLKASPRATTRTPGAPSRASLTAPRPRPPQPMRPTLISSLPAAKAPGRTGAARVPPTRAALVFRKSRREGFWSSLCWVMSLLQSLREALGALLRDFRAQPLELVALAYGADHAE